MTGHQMKELARYVSEKGLYIVPESAVGLASMFHMGIGEMVRFDIYEKYCNVRCPDTRHRTASLCDGENQATVF